MTLETVFWEYKTAIIFYTVLLILIIINRKKFEIQAKIIALYRTKVGLKLMEKFGIKYREFFRLVGLIGIGIGFLGMIFIFLMLVFQLYLLIVHPTPGQGAALLIPGIKIPGSAIFVPLWYGIISIFVLATVHEFFHGVLARAYDLKIKSSGIVFFGPIIGAFVEPDEKQLMKRSDVEQYSIYAAGPFSNLVLGTICFVIFLALSAGVMNYLEPSGVSFDAYGTENTSPFEVAGIEPGTKIIEVDGEEILTANDLLVEISKKEPNIPVTIKTNETTAAIVTAHHPNDNEKAYFGISNANTVYELKEGYSEGASKVGYNVLSWFKGLFLWLYRLNLIVGLINLLPMGPIDGGRMFQTAARKIRGKKKGDKLWKQMGWFCLIVLVLTLILSYAINLIL